MNERIRDLSAVAIEYADFYTGLGVEETYTSIYSEKFASGMITEVVEFIHKDYLRDYDADSRKSLLLALKEHFGVDA